MAIDGNQAEHEVISTSLELEEIDTNLFRSKSLWVPTRSRGVFGGQVISQAIVAATNSVDPQYGLHSLHCYFLLSASPALPILYYVERLREGRSYTTRSVKAAQNGRIVFIMMCSFHRPELQHPSHQWPMPLDVPSPDDVESDVSFYNRWAHSEGIADNTKKILMELTEERSKSPLAVKIGIERKLPDGNMVVMHWMKARGVPKFGPAFQKCILGYMSDMNFISVAPRALGLKRFSKGPTALSMSSSLDHSIFFYNDTFDCSDWLLYVVISPRTGSGRGVVHGRMYTRDGTLVAITTQEGVVRADVPHPSRKETAKL